VGRIRQELTLLSERAIEPVEEGVEAGSEPTEFIIGVGDR
jgi:hypothetical protein